MLFCILTQVAVCYSTANSIAKEADATISGFKYAVASSSAGNADDITAEPQNYRPYKDRRTSAYNTGYYNRRPFYPNNKRSLPDFESSVSTTPSPTSTTPSPTSTTQPQTSITQSSTSSTQSPTSTTQSPVATTEFRTSCYATNGTIEELGICWDKKNKVISYISEENISPHTFGLFYKYKEEEDADLEPIYVQAACYIATQFLDNQIVMCAAKHNCYNKEGKAYYTYCLNNVCTCILDERYKPNIPSKKVIRICH